MFKTTHKEKVEIIAGNTRISMKKYKLLEGNKIQIEKSGRGRGHVGVTATFDPQRSFKYTQLQCTSCK